MESADEKQKEITCIEIYKVFCKKNDVCFKVSGLSVVW